MAKVKSRVPTVTIPPNTGSPQIINPFDKKALDPISDVTTHYEYASTISTTDGKLLLINANNPSDTLEIQFVPNELNITRGGKVESVEIIGRNLPFYQFVNGERKIELELLFHTDRRDGQDVLTKVNWIESMTFNETFEEGTPSLFVQFGAVLSDSRWIIETPIKVKLMDFDAEKNFAPRRAQVNLTLCQEFDGVDLKRSQFKKSRL